MGTARIATTILLVGTTLAACMQGSVDLATLQRDPASALRLTDATELGHFSGEQRLSPDGPVEAYDARVFGTQQSEAAVLDYYQRELARLGWKSDTLEAIRNTVELRAWAWCKRGMTARLAIEDKARAFRPDFYKGQDFQTVFEASLKGRDPNFEKCPG